MDTTKQCANCKDAVYCSKDCQKKHWSKHKPNCIRSDHSIHGLFRLCFEDLLPVSGSTIARDYGFDNVRENHGDVLWGISSTPAMAENILLALYKCIKSDVCCLEMGESHLVFSSIGASRKMIVEALENNKLDDLIHLFIKNVFSRHGPGSAQYCFGWIWIVWWLAPLELRVSRGSRSRKWDERSITNTMEVQNQGTVAVRQYKKRQPFHFRSRSFQASRSFLLEG